MTLPPLPEPHLLVFDDALQSPIDGWTRSQVEAYARAAVEAEREDADRYRWLRDGIVAVTESYERSGDDEYRPVYGARCLRITKGLRLPTLHVESDDVDAAIDRARGAKERGND